MRFTEMEKLAGKLMIAGVPFEVTIQPYFKTPQIWYPNRANAVGDVACNSITDGGKVGLLEIRGDELIGEDYKEYHFEGWLTADQVAERIVKHYYEG